MLNKQINNILFLSISLSAISLGITACSSDDKTISAIDTTEEKTEIITTEVMNTKKTVSQVSMNEAITKEQPADDMLAHGEKAHKNHCYKCHTDTVYTREDRFVKSIDALSKQVLRCKEGNDVPWFDEDSDAVVQFLNQKYYRF